MIIIGDCNVDSAHRQGSGALQTIPLPPDFDPPDAGRSIAG